MKRLIFIMIAMFSMVIANAQNYAGSSKFTDNWSVTLQGGVVTPFNECFVNGSTTPIIVLGADKYVTPWLGIGIEGRTSIGTGANYNPHTAFDAVNINVYGKINLINLFNFNGTRRMFEPVFYTGLGWGHTNCSDAVNKYESTGMVGMVPGLHSSINSRNYLTYRTGVELNFHIGKERAWAIVVNPSVVWGDICNGILDKRNGNFELTAGVVYHFKTSNGKHNYTKARLYNQAEIDALNAKIQELENRPPVVIEKKAAETNAVAQVAVHNDATYAVSFNQNSAELTDTAKAILDKVPTNVTVNVAGSTSPEGSMKRNTALAVERAKAVANYLKSRGVTVNSVVGGEAGRAAVITVLQ